MGFRRKPVRNTDRFEWDMPLKEPFGMWELHAGWFPQLTWEDDPIELVTKGRAIDVLDNVLDNWVHGGDEDYIIAEFEEELNKEKED